MKISKLEPLSPEAVVLLQFERPIEPASEDLRSSAMRRARSAMGAGALAPANFGLRRYRTWVGSGAALVLVGLAAAGWQRLHSASSRTADVGQAGLEQQPPQAAASAIDIQATPVVAPTAGATEPVASASASLQRAERRGQELKLMESARRAATNGDFATVLSVAREHEQRFPRGLLVEEREALRVKALLGLGRKDEAKEAVERFRKRFPQSVLLPSVERMVGASQ